MKDQFIKLEISIIDNGHGISPEGIQNLFTEYQKLTENERINKGGTGLGLSICKQIVEQMGGTITCRSKLGIGTEFKISMPIKIKTYENEIIRLRRQD